MRGGGRGGGADREFQGPHGEAGDVEWALHCRVREGEI